MTINAACTGCHKTLRVPESTVGKKVRCPLCQTVFRVSAPTPPPEEFDSGDEARDPAPIPAEQPVRVGRAPEPEEHQDPDPPA